MSLFASIWRVASSGGGGGGGLLLQLIDEYVRLVHCLVHNGLFPVQFIPLCIIPSLSVSDAK